jgi:fumarylpyruvate hydrolase
MSYAVVPPPIPSLAIEGTAERFPVHRVFCVGRNYAAHAREMGSDPTREPPFFFMKPAAAVLDASAPAALPYPRMTANFHHEVELVVAIGRGGADIPVERALEHVHGYAVGLDMTRRDLQFQARDKGRPWEFGKSFSASAPIGALRRASPSEPMTHGRIELSVQGTTRQASDLREMLWSVAECIATLSRYDALTPGDLLMTGTPEGVGPVVPGDVIRATIAGLAPIEVRVVAAG